MSGDIVVSDPLVDNLIDFTETENPWWYVGTCESPDCEWQVAGGEVAVEEHAYEHVDECHRRGYVGRHRADP